MNFPFALYTPLLGWLVLGTFQMQSENLQSSGDQYWISLNGLRRWHMQHNGLITPVASTGILKFLQQAPWIRAKGEAPYLSLFVRVEGFRLTRINRMIFSLRQLVVTPAIRGEYYLVPLEQWSLALATLQGGLSDKYAEEIRKLGLKPAKLNSIRRSVLNALAGKNGLNAQAWRGAVANEVFSGIRETPGGAAGLSAVFLHAVAQLLESGQALPLHAAERIDDPEIIYFSTADHLGIKTPGEMDPSAIPNRLAAAYFAAYGPASLKDFIRWSALSPKAAAKAVEGCPEELLEFTCDDLPDRLYLTAGLLPSLERAVDSRDEAIRLIPYQDAIFSGYRETAPRFLDPRCLNKLFPKGDDEALPAIMHNGKVIGTWSLKVSSGEIVFNYFSKPTVHVEKRAEAEGRRLAEFAKTEFAQMKPVVLTLSSKRSVPVYY